MKINTEVSFCDRICLSIDKQPCQFCMTFKGSCFMMSLNKGLVISPLLSACWGELTFVWLLWCGEVCGLSSSSIICRCLMRWLPTMEDGEVETPGSLPPAVFGPSSLCFPASVKITFVSPKLPASSFLYFLSQSQGSFESTGLRQIHTTLLGTELISCSTLYAQDFLKLPLTSSQGSFTQSLLPQCLAPGWILVVLKDLVLPNHSLRGED